MCITVRSKIIVCSLVSCNELSILTVSVTDINFAIRLAESASCCQWLDIVDGNNSESFVGCEQRDECGRLVRSAVMETYV